MSRSTQVLVPVLLLNARRMLGECRTQWSGAAVTERIWKEQLVRKNCLLPWVLLQLVFFSDYPFALEIIEELSI